MLDAVVEIKSVSEVGKQKLSVAFWCTESNRDIKCSHSWQCKKKKKKKKGLSVQKA